MSTAPGYSPYPPELTEATLGDLHLDFEIGFFEAVLKHEPANADALATLGAAYARRQLPAKAAELARRSILLRPDDGEAYYRLACELSKLGDLDEALDAARRTVELGFTTYENLSQDSELRNLQGDPRFKRLASD